MEKMGIKKSLLVATSKVTTRAKQSGIGRRLTSPGTTSVGTRTLEWLYLIILFLLAAGVINALNNAGQAGINGSPIVPSPNAQNITETFILMFAYIVGSLGAYALYLSGRQTIRARSAEMFFVGGIALISMAMTIGYFILSVK